MRDWMFKIELKHLLNHETEDLKGVKKLANDFYKKLNTYAFDDFEDLEAFREFEVPEYMTPVEYFNDLFDKLYDYADDNRIWIK